MHQAVLLRFTPEVKAVLSLVEPYVVYGTPSVGTVRDLIFKYGFMRYNGKKTAIKSNEQVEEMFGKDGIICLEDVVHELVTLGPHFDTVKKALYTFVLPNPKDGWEGKKGKSFKKGGIAGYRGDKVNEFLKTIL
jgi:large subunit ribosomal protein L7e